MKHAFLVFLSLSFATLATAQPPARLRQQQEQAQAAKNKALTTNMYQSAREFPVAQGMPDDVTWRRDVYRTLDLSQDANAPLYYPVEPQGNRMSLFTYLFKLMLRGQVKGYAYQLNGNEDFSDSNVVKLRAFMDSYHIFYEQKDGRVHVSDVDLPSADVKTYYIKESSYYDPVTATFHTKVDAICPVLTRGDDFGGAPVKYPLFWVRYDDVSPFLARLQLTVSSLNNASVMSANDYFALNRYSGKIYKTDNLQGTILMNEATNDSTLTLAQNKIEKELVEVQQNVWGKNNTSNPTDSVTQTETVVPQKKESTRRGRVAKSKKEKATSGSSNAAAPRVTVRRQRH